MKRNSFLILGCVLLILSSVNLPSVWAEVYDDFSGPYLDQEKWNNWEFVRKVEHGRLISEVAAYGSTRVMNELTFREPGSIYAIEADVRVTNVEGDLRVSGSSSFAIPNAALLGSFYNDGLASGPSSRKGDVLASIRIEPNDGELWVFWYVLRTENDAGTSFTLLASGSFPNPVHLHRVYKLFLGFNPESKTFEFRVDGETQSWTSSHPTINSPGLPFKLIRTDVSFRQPSVPLNGRISAEFDNVVAYDVEGNVFMADDFSSPTIDPEKWSSYEFVRKIRHKKLLSELRSLGAGMNNSLVIKRDPYEVDALGAQVVLRDYYNPNGVSTRARLGRWFYNDSGPPYNGSTGDVWAEVYLGGTSEAPQAGWLVARSNNSTATNTTLLASGSFPLSVHLGGRYDLLVAWDGSRFTFVCNEFAARYEPKGNVYPPFSASPLLGTRMIPVTSGPSLEASISATFDHAIVNEFPDVYTLSVSKGGSGAGVITSEPGGISCGEKCNQDYVASTVVKLKAVPDEGSMFTGWEGDCLGRGAKTRILMDADKSCTAIFQPFRDRSPRPED